MKAQLNIEYLAAAFIYLSALGVIMFLGISDLPRLSSNAEDQSLNLEAEQLTTKILTTTGKYDTGSMEGEAWQEHPNDVKDFGLATEFLEVERDKLTNISTVAKEDFNYTQFKNVTEVDHQYRFRFTWKPVIETFNTFERCSPPAFIEEPVSCDGNPDTPYERAGNTIHYGSQFLNGSTYYFLVASYDGRYNATYVTTEKLEVGDADPEPEWDFRGENQIGEDESFLRRGQKFTVGEIHDEGNILVLEQHLKTFGASRDTQSRTIKFNRYASLEGEPLMLEVWTW